MSTRITILPIFYFVHVQVSCVERENCHMAYFPFCICPSFHFVYVLVSCVCIACFLVLTRLMYIDDIYMSRFSSRIAEIHVSHQHENSLYIWVASAADATHIYRLYIWVASARDLYMSCVMTRIAYIYQSHQHEGSLYTWFAPEQAICTRKNSSCRKYIK